MKASEHSAPDPGPAAAAERLRRQDLVLSMIPRDEVGRLLHVGCDDGSLTFRLPGLAIVGIDPDADRVELARARQPDDRRFSFVVADALTLDDAVGEAGFDGAVVTDALAPAAVGLSFPAAWDALAAAVRPGGFIVYDHQDSRRPALPARRLDRLTYAEGDRLRLLELYRL